MVDLILLSMVIASAVSLCVVNPTMHTKDLPALTEENEMQTVDTDGSEILDEAA